MNRFACLLLVPLAAGAEVRNLSLRDAVDLALKQNPDVALARLDERKAEEAVRIARDPFIPKVFVGSGLAWSSGMPMSVEGSTPSIVQARAVGSVFDRPQSYRIAAAKENRRGAALDTAARQDEVAWRTAELFIEAEKAAKALEVTRRESDGLERALESTRARVAEGRELPIAAKRSELALARARLRNRSLETSLRAAESALAAVVGLEAPDTVRIVPAERPAPVLPEGPDAAVSAALENSKEVRALESKLVAKGLDLRAAKAGWLPRADLLAQYALLGRYNNYDEFFNRFERHNGQLGVSFQFPIFGGPAIKAQAGQAEAEAAQLRIQLRNARRRIEDNTRQAYAELQQADAAQQVARLDLEVARDQVSILLARAEEGRASLGELEDARVLETDKWIGFYDAAAQLEKARLAVLRQAGTLAAALQ
jgi:outer membrane protein TolC